MNNYEIVIINIVGFIAFLIAGIYGFLRYEKTKKITHVWLPITTALFLFALVALIGSIELIPGLEVLEGVEVLFLIVGATLLCCAFCLYRKERELAKDGRDGKLKKKDGKRYEKMKEWLEGI